MRAAILASGWIVAGCAFIAALLASRARAREHLLVSRACHELRGPLAAARLGLEFCGRTGELPPATGRAIDLELARAGLALDDLARNRCRPNATESPLELVDLADLLTDSVEAARAAAPDREIGLAISHGAGATFRGNRLRVAQATGNLLANAIEHGAGEIEVRLGVRGGVARIEVLDRGAGLPAPVAELARRPSRRSRGHGLAIAVEIAASQGGRLFSGPTDSGARLVLELPLIAGAWHARLA